MTKMIGSFCDVEDCNEKAVWFDPDPRDPKGFVALCEGHYQDPHITRFYQLHLEKGVLVKKQNMIEIPIEGKQQKLKIYSD